MRLQIYVAPSEQNYQYADYYQSNGRAQYEYLIVEKLVDSHIKRSHFDEKSKAL